MKQFQNSYAVVIGINDYQNGIPELKTAANDAKRLAEVLVQDHGYSDTNVRCLTQDVNGSIIRELLGTLRNEVRSDDRLLFYFAGHGVALEGEDGPAGYLIPQDASRQDADTYLAMTELHDGLSKIECRHMLLILDCCFAGAFRWAATRDLGAIPDVIHRERYQRFLQYPAWQVITSAAFDQKALDVLSGNTIGQRKDEGTHSPFAEALFRGLNGAADLPSSERPDGDGVITATELYLYLNECVASATEDHRTQQVPGIWQLSKHFGGEYIFLRSPDQEPDLPPAPPLNEENNPYRGLSSFDEQHSRFFFGRTELIKKLQMAVNDKPLTVVLGASGTGKSSLVKAGLLPELRSSKEVWGILEQMRADTTSEETKTAAVIRPGSAPLKSLASVVHPELEFSNGLSLRQAKKPKNRQSLEQENEPVLNSINTPAQGDLRSLAAKFSDEPHAFSNNVRQWLGAMPEQSKLLLVVDQFEELVTLCGTRQERDQFITQLSNALRDNSDRFRLVLTLRSDFEPQFTETALGNWNRRAKLTQKDAANSNKEMSAAPVHSAWPDARFVVPPMSQDELREVIEKPASVRVIYFEEGLVDVLINEVVQTPGGLPLLSFTLSELYRNYVERRSDDRCLTVADYDQLGGVAGSLRRRATEIYNELGKPKSE